MVGDQRFGHTKVKAIEIIEGLLTVFSDGGHDPHFLP